MKFSPVFTDLIRAVVLITSYVLLGQAALTLAITPGFATAVYPPIGIAVALTLLWGYRMLIPAWIGSMIIEMISTAYGQLPIAFTIASSSTFTVFLACWLVKRFGNFHQALTFERSIIALFVLAGPVACLVSASLATFILYHFDQISSVHLSSTWFTWWTGDTLGVTIFVPLVFTLLATPRSVWKPRLLTVGLPLLISMVLIFSLFSRVQQQTHSNVQQRFFQQAKQISTSFQFRVSKVLQQMQALERLMVQTPQLTQAQFSQFLQHYPWNGAGVLCFDWVQWLPATQPSSGLSIRPFDNSVSDSAPDQHAVVGLTASATDYASRVGLDLWSEPIRREALEFAVVSGQVSMTAPVTLQNGEQAVLFFIPVFADGMTPATEALRWQQLRGFIGGVFKAATLVDTSLRLFDSSEFHLKVKDLGSQHYYFRDPATTPVYGQHLAWSQLWSYAGRSIELLIDPSQSFLDKNIGLQSWYVLAGGLVLSSLLGIFLLILTGRSARIEHLIAQRTKELSSILDNANESIVIVDQQGLIERVNKETSLLFGYRPDELIRTPISKLLATLPRHQNHKLLQPLTVEHLQQWTGSMQELTGISHNGGQIPLELGLSRVDLADKHLFTLMLHDLRERKKIERMKNEFISTVSHELRTPLTSINGSLGLLNGGVAGPLPEQAQQLVQIAKINTDRLTHLVNDILDIEKLEFGQLKLKPEPLAVYDVLQEALTQNKAYADKYQVALRLQPGPNLSALCLYLDKFRLLQVLSNLISNAVKFSPSHAEVTLSYYQTEQGVEIRVQDRGCGIAPSFRSKIFQKFAQADNTDSRSNQGSGLGLNISKTLVEMMQGSIDFSSEIGSGTTFMLWFPLHPVSKNAPEA